MVVSAVFIVVIVGIVVAANARRRDALDPIGRAGVGRARRLADGRSVPDERSPLRIALDRWIDAGLIDPRTATAIERHELARAAAPTNRVPMAAEAVGYLGAGLVLAALALVIGNRWEDLAPGARVAVLAGPTVFAAFGGWWVGRSTAEPLERLGSVLWTLAVVGVAGTAGEVWYDVIHDADPPDTGTVLFPAAFAFVAAGLCWWSSRTVLQETVLFATSVFTVVGLVDALHRGGGDLPPAAMGTSLLALAAMWTLGGLAGRITPTLPALLLGPALALVAAQVLRGASDHLGLWVGVAVAVTLLALGAARSEVAVLLVGTVGLFQWTPQIALYYLGDSLGAEATLAAIGVLLLTIAGSMMRLWPWFTRRRRGRGPATVDPRS